MQQGESLITHQQSFSQQYNSKCSQWRSEPVSNRRCNNVGCVIIFCMILGGFIGVGAYYINQKGRVSPDSILYVSTYAKQISLCLLITLVLSFLYILLIKLMPKLMVYIIIFLSMAFLLINAILGFMAGSIYIGLPFLITFVIYSLVLLCYRNKIKTGIILVKVSTQFLTQKCAVFISPLLKIIMNLLFTFFWIYSFCCIFLVLLDKKQKNEDDTGQILSIIFWIVIWIFFTSLLYYIMVFTISVCCSFWYYKVQKNFLVSAYRWIFTSSFGSIVFGSLLNVLLSVVRIFVDQNSKAKKCLCGICLCICSLCIRNLEYMLRILNHNSVIVMSVTGENYINSAKTTIGLLYQFFGLLSVSEIITSLLVFWGIIIVMGASGVINYLFLQGQNLGFGPFFLLMVVTILGSIMVSSLVFSVLVESVSSVFIFYCFDTRFKALGLESHNMPAQINEALGNPQLNQKS